MNENLSVIPKSSKSEKQEILGVVVNKVNGEFVFNYATSRDPIESEMQALKDFRNKFVEELDIINAVIGCNPS